MPDAGELSSGGRSGGSASSSALRRRSRAGSCPRTMPGCLIEGLVFSIFALGLNLLLGYTGLPSLGHAAYFAAGAYAAGLIAVKVTPDFWAGLACGLVVSTALGAAFGLLALRTSGVYFLMITLALAQVAWGVVFSWRDLTGGDDGLRSIPRPTLAIPGRRSVRHHRLLRIHACGIRDCARADARNSAFSLWPLVARREGQRGADGCARLQCLAS